MVTLSQIRKEIDETKHISDELALSRLIDEVQISAVTRKAATARATDLVYQIRNTSAPGLMEVFLAEYGLSTDEGVALMCLAEALLRVPDAPTIDALIEDKIAPSHWSEHLGQSSSPLVNASTWALMLTGQVLKDGHGVTGVLRSAIKRLGEPVIRTAVARAMKELGAQFVLGESIEDALDRGRGQVKKGYTYSFDMLGEAAMTMADADTFFADYAHAITTIAQQATGTDVHKNPGISVKLSALFPRYDALHAQRANQVLTERLLFLAQKAKAAGIGLNVDAEEADRLTMSLDVIEPVLRDPSLAGWNGFGIVVQAYGKRALTVLKWINALAENADRNVAVRLVKGAYWDAEIKRAQVDGMPGYPVFTTKAATDVSYLCCAQYLLQTKRIYPQFATHNAHSVASILEMADHGQDFEFQRLHGMGDALHDAVLDRHGTKCRIYAPVGQHRDLLAYLVRRLLENGANSSFVNQIVDTSVPAETIAADPFDQLAASGSKLLQPQDLFAPERQNSVGWDVLEPASLADLIRQRDTFSSSTWTAGPLVFGLEDKETGYTIRNPANPDDVVGKASDATAMISKQAISNARPWAAGWSSRAKVLSKAADLYEENTPELCAILAREAGKTILDAVSEVREAVDFLRFYGARAHGLEPARGVFTCISPWNFPLAIFTGQIAAALATGNAVLAKPAEATPLIAHYAVDMLHKAGVPLTALQYLPGKGSDVGAALTSAPSVDGVCFTGSTATAQKINRTMAQRLAPNAPLIAETGGINAMIVDSTALPEQAVRDIIASAFQSAGQRCSALRVLYLQKDVAKTFLTMLYGAMDQLQVGDPLDAATDVGPVIDATAQNRIMHHITQARSEGRLLHEGRRLQQGHFVAPTALRVSGIQDVKVEVFGPVLHIATFEASQLNAVIDAINDSGFGLTFGMQSRIDDRIDHVVQRVRAGNIYINRNQIGAVVGSQPFGGEGLSGTGPKAGGPTYLKRFVKGNSPVKVALESHVLPGPTGESNHLTTFGRGTVVCMGPTQQDLELQIKGALAAGCQPQDGTDFSVSDLASLQSLDAVVSFAGPLELRKIRVALASRSGPIVPLLSEPDFAQWLVVERHVCVDTTAAGGNASLLAGQG